MMPVVLGLAACPAADDPSLDEGASASTSTGDTGEATADEAEETAETETGAAMTDWPTQAPTVLFPRSRILDDELGVLVNDEDPQSVAVADYYMRARGLPPENLIHLAFPADQDVMTEADFDVAKATVEAELPAGIQALALTWTRPYRVDCMSITTAFSQGFSLGFCGGCALTTPSPYFDSPSLRPFDDHGLRPTMMLAGASARDVFALIDRGLLADGGAHPSGDGYLVRTTDPARSVRFPDFAMVPGWWDHEGGLTMTYVDNADGSGDNVIRDAEGVMFYFTGLASVADIETNTYLPGAIADHLTSFGGQVPTSGQMSCVAWLAAGATGSYGTVVEPCNHTQKFPRASVAIEHYFRGETLVEAYTKSVEWPGQGLFVGDPLARPWDGSSVDYAAGVLTITTTILQPGITYLIQAGEGADGPWETIGEGTVGYSLNLELEVPNATAPYYRIEPMP